MAVSCDPNDLLQASSCVDCIPPGKMQSVIVYLLAVLSGSSTDPNYLMAQARCMDCIPDGYKPAVIIWLLCQIASAAPGVLPQIIANITPNNNPNSVQYPNSFNLYSFDPAAPPQYQNKPDYTSIVTWTANNGGIITLGAAPFDVFQQLVPRGETVTSLKVIQAPGYDPVLNPFGMSGLDSLPNLQYLDVSGCYGLNVLNLYECPQLMYLNAQKCNLNSLQFYAPKAGVPPGIRGVACDYNPGLISLDCTGCSNLANVSCSQCNLSSLILVGCSALAYLNCTKNALISLDPSPCSALSNLECGNNQLTALSVAGLVNLTNLGADNNQMTSLNVSGVPTLQSLSAINNLLTAVTATGSGLLNVFLSGNKLTTLNLTGTGVLNLDISNNLFTAFTSPEPMIFLYAQNNQLTVAAVNAILAALSTNGKTGGIVQLQGQNPGAVPTGAGAAAVTTLQAETPPWTVEVDVSSNPQLSWTPNTALIQWGDKNGNQQGNQAAFNAAADYPSVTYLQSNSAITAISNLSSLPSLNRILFSYNPGLVVLTLTGCAALTFLNLENSGITSLNVSPCVKLKQAFLDGNAISVVANVDAILSSLVTNAQTNGTLFLQGGTNAHPDAAGLSSIATLKSRGWAVQNN